MSNDDAKQWTKIVEYHETEMIWIDKKMCGSTEIKCHGVPAFYIRKPHLTRNGNERCT